MFLDKSVTFRLRNEEWKAIEKQCKRFDLKFDNPSHFMRVAVMKAVKEMEEVKDEDLHEYL